MMCVTGGLIIVDTDILIHDLVLLNYNSNLLTIMELNFSRGGCEKHHNITAHGAGLNCSPLKHDHTEVHLTDTRGTGEAAAWPAPWRARSITFCLVWEQQGMFLQYGAWQTDISY